MQQDEISLREIFETIWHGKFIVITVTIVLMLFGVMLGFFVISPTYEARSTVRIDGEDKRPLLNSLSQSLRSDAAITNIIESLNLDKEEYSIEKLRKAMKFEVIKDTLIMNINVQGNDPGIISNIANAVAFDAGRRIEISERSKKIVEAQNMIIVLEDKISVTQETLKETIEQLAQTPEKLTVQQALARDSELHNIISEQIDYNSPLGAILFESEHINPVYNVLVDRKAQLSIQLAELEAELNNQQMLIKTNEEKISELENKLLNNFDSLGRSERLLSEFTTVFVSPAVEPNEPIKPNKLLLIATSIVFGILIGLVIVFVRHYWREEKMSAQYSA